VLWLSIRPVGTVPLVTAKVSAPVPPVASIGLVVPCNAYRPVGQGQGGYGRGRIIDSDRVALGEAGPHGIGRSDGETEAANHGGRRTGNDPVGPQGQAGRQDA